MEEAKQHVLDLLEEHTRRFGFDETMALLDRWYASRDLLTTSVSGLQKDCRARCDDGSACGSRTYRGRPYCPKHWQRYLRHGDPTITLRPWERTATTRPGRPRKERST